MCFIYNMIGNTNLRRPEHRITGQKAAGKTVDEGLWCNVHLAAERDSPICATLTAYDESGSMGMLIDHDSLRDAFQ